MADEFEFFQKIAINSTKLSTDDIRDTAPEHPFQSRNIHPVLHPVSKTLFDNGHYSQATFEAFKFVDKTVAKLSGETTSGQSLMMKVFSENKPLLTLTPCQTQSEKDEQEGFRFLFAGSTMAIRNPRAHEYSVNDSPDECLDHLALASILLRRLEAAGYNL